MIGNVVVGEHGEWSLCTPRRSSAMRTSVDGCELSGYLAS